MKQKRNGKKVYNWHRPMGRSQLKRRFLRNRHQDSPVEVELEHEEETVSLADVDIWPWEIANYCCRSCYEASLGYADADDALDYQLTALLDELLKPQKWKFALDRLLPRERLPQNEEPPHSEASLSVEQRLAEHIEQINAYSRSPETLKDSLRVAALDTRNLRAIYQISDASGNPNLGRLLLLFSPFWLRKPESCPNVEDPFDSLSHLFLQHEPPGFLFPVWLQQQEMMTAQFKWLIWFILIGQGGSLKRAAKRFDWIIEGKFQHHLAEIPAGFSPSDATQLGEVKRLGGSLQTYYRITRFPPFVFDPSDGQALQAPGSKERRFWTETVQWLARYEDELTDHDSEQILQWALHEWTESVRQPAIRPFVWKNRSPQACLRRAEAYFQRISQPYADYHWESQGWDLSFESPTGESWTMTELSDGRALFKEGQRMHHCVAAYASFCQAGRSAIFSLSCETEARLTIEIELATRRIVQARGKYNRSANTAEEAALAQWRELIGI